MCESPCTRPTQLGDSVPGGFLAERSVECVNECQPMAMLNEVYEKMTAMANSQVLDGLRAHTCSLTVFVQQRTWLLAISYSMEPYKWVL